MIDMIITPKNTGHSHVDPASFGQGKIKMQTLDGLNLPKFDYVKLDCEGYEFNIVRGGENCLKEYRPVIVVLSSVGDFRYPGKKIIPLPPAIHGSRAPMCGA